MVTNIGMESKELPHSLAPHAAAAHLLLARGKVADQNLKSLARGESPTRRPLPLHLRSIVRSNVGTPIIAYVLQTLHRLAQLHVQPLLLPPLPHPPLPLPS